MFLDVLIDSFFDSIKMLPMLFIICLITDYLIAHRKWVKSINSYIGVFSGAALGIVPQCGVGVGFAQLYAKKLIGFGMLMALLLSSSDEAMIVALSQYRFLLVLQVILTKFIIAIIIGAIITFITRDVQLKEQKIDPLLEDDPNEKKIGALFLKTFKYTLKISIWVFIVVFILNFLINLIGLEVIQNDMANMGYFQPVVTALIGVIPNCATSIFILQTYTSGIINYGSLISGLCANTGFAAIVIFKTLPFKKALKVMGILMGVSIIAGIIIMSI